MTTQTSKYTSVILDQIRADLKKQLGNDLTDEIELFIDEKIKIGIQDTEKRFLALLATKKNA